MAAPCFHRVTRVTGGHEIANFARTHPNTFSTALEKLSDRTLKIFPLHSKKIKEVGAGRYQPLLILISLVDNGHKGLIGGKYK